MMGQQPGRITSGKTVWCGECEQWEYIDSAADARKAGWKQTKRYGWLCPACYREKGTNANKS